MMEALPQAVPELVWKTVDLGENKIPATLGVAPGGDTYSPFLEGAWQGLQFSIAPYPGLTGRENQVLVLSCLGQEEPGIAAHIVLSQHTVHSQRKGVLHKLNSDRMNVCVDFALLAGVFHSVKSKPDARLPVFKPEEQAIVRAFRKGAHNRKEVVQATALKEGEVETKTKAMLARLRVANMAGAILLDGLTRLSAGENPA